MGDSMDIAALGDHAKEMLGTVAADLSARQTRQQQTDRAQGRSDAGTRKAPTAAQAACASRIDQRELIDGARHDLHHAFTSVDAPRAVSTSRDERLDTIPERLDLRKERDASEIHLSGRNSEGRWLDDQHALEVGQVGPQRAKELARSHGHRYAVDDESVHLLDDRATVEGEGV
jgi:hypothetical protein